MKVYYSYCKIIAQPEYTITKIFFDMLYRPFLWVQRTSHQNSKYDSPLFQLCIYMQILIQPNKSVGREGKSSSLKSLYLCEAVQNIWSMWDLRFLWWWWFKFNCLHDGIPIWRLGHSHRVMPLWFLRCYYIVEKQCYFIGISFLKTASKSTGVCKKFPEVLLN